MPSAKDELDKYLANNKEDWVGPLPARHGEFWDYSDDKRLLEGLSLKTFSVIARELRRTPHAIKCRLIKHGMITHSLQFTDAGYKQAMQNNDKAHAKYIMPVTVNLPTVHDDIRKRMRMLLCHG